MALDGTYAGLVASVAAFLDRGDLTATIPDFVVLAEARFNRVLRTPEMLTRNDAFVVNSQYVAVPTGFVGVKRFALTAQPQVTLEYLAPDVLATKRWASSAGQPGYYTIAGGFFEFLSSPAASYTASLLYYSRLTPVATAANWLLTGHPDLYLYGALAAAEPFLKNDERLAVWKSLLNEGTDELNLQGERQSVGARPMTRTRPIGLPARHPHG